MILRLTVCLATLLCLAAPASAEKADRDKPMLLEASKISIDDLKKIQILEGDVIITKGTMVLKAARVVVTEDAYGFQKGVAFAAPGAKATFRQKREGREDYIEGEAERIEYDTRSEVAELFHKAWIRSGEDELRGDYVWYDALNEKYLANAATASEAGAPPPRVRAIIQPKGKGSAPSNEKRGEQLELRGAQGISTEFDPGPAGR
ncbi:lipopolysaccharide transport periplasmic protein LptA [Azonexus sp.]|uniref:lipopolysaccharide transport periplasmic protein LptA n=1 Tax=Azonexus sp. TaxID=1872668 RepID=UPI0039E54E56